MNKIILAGALLPILALIAPHAFASHQSSSERFSIGWTDGENMAASDISTGQFNSNSGANSQCPDGHTHQYCVGWNQGYSDEFTRSLQQNTVQSQGASEATSIHGNNNHVTNVINQGQASDVGGSSGSSHGQNPSCIIACGAVNVR